MDRLDHLDLNRATLDRQLLLRRAALPAWNAIEHLGGLQAQAPLAPYVGLWTRLAGFGHDELKELLTERIVVRAHVMRNTVHLVTAEDYVCFRPLFQPLMDRALAGHFGPHLAGIDLDQLRGRRHQPAGRDRADPGPARRAAGSPLAGSRPRLAGLRGHPPAAPGPGAAARPVGPRRAGHLVPGQRLAGGPEPGRVRTRPAP